GINGILFAAPVADLIAIIIAAILPIPFFKSLDKSKSTKEETEPAVIMESQKGVIITIAREHGSAGKQIGKIVAEKLNIPFYYKEVTALAAQESGLDKEFISDINVNSPTILHDLYLSTNVILQAVAAQDKIIKKIADNGACVIVGRAADYVLRDYEDVVRIFIHAPKDYRMNKVMEMYGDSKSEAQNSIERSDEARAAYYKNISGLSWGDTHNYDLSIDSSIGIPECAEAICGYIKGKVSRKAV
ncbi:MAG: cytidylate kinase-like family protein, partial [Lachnospiraceae bacterium]|nr:cytidylate kinase-like family protein [Lachnospiraceae bacterium]